MTTLRQAAQAALDKLNTGELLCEVTTASILNEALEAPEQEPVAWISITQHGSTTTIDNTFDDRVINWPLGEYKLYAAPVEAPDIEALTKERDALMAAGKLALDMCVEFSRAPMTQVEYLGLLRVIGALKQAGVSE